MMPRYDLTEAGLRLIRHAEQYILRADSTAATGRLQGGTLPATTDPHQWRAEAALLRIVSVIEAYVDATSIVRMSRLVDRSQPHLLRLLEDFEFNSSSNWKQRKDAFAAYHGFRIPSCRGWQKVEAGIEVRNSLAHGLGRLTARQRGKSGLVKMLSCIDVTVGGGHIHLSATTIPKVAVAAREFLTDIDSRIEIPSAGCEGSSRAGK